MQGSTIKTLLFASLIASSLPLLACGDANTPTSPTQSGPTVSAADSGTQITLRGGISQLTRSGPGGVDVVFHVNDQVVRGDAATVVVNGPVHGNTTFLRDGQTVAIDGRQRADHLYARLIVIDR